MNSKAVSFPAEANSIGKKVEYLSGTLLPARRFEDYVLLMGELLDERVHYVDPVHEFRDRDSVLKMLAKYVPRASNEGFEFSLVADTPEFVVWNWTIRLKIRFTPFLFTIHGLVHAKIQNGKIVYQREYYDPMESIEVIPLVGRLYKLILRMG